LGCGPELAGARRLADVNGAIEQRQAAQNGGIADVAQWLSDRFLEGGQAS
jgi:hypothetical protein